MGHVVNVTYALEIEVDVPWGFDLNLSLPVTIGTVPFRATYGVALPPNPTIMHGNSAYSMAYDFKFAFVLCSGKVGLILAL